MKKLPHVRNAIYGQPWAITPDWLNSICEIFERHVAGDGKEISAAYGMGQMEEEEEKYQVINGVAVLPLCGPLFPKANIFTKLSNATSYQGFGQIFNEAIERNDVSAIVIHADSPGGSCLGLGELATEIFEARKSSDKPIIALADGLCASAAYMICSQCDAMFCTEGSMVGSIGTIARFDNYDRAERNEGNDSFVLRSSELKAPGSGGPITPNQMQSLQKIVAAYFEQFKDAVTRGRPGINIDSVSTGEVWIGADAVGMGLCDGVLTMDEVSANYGTKSRF